LLGTGNLLVSLLGSDSIKLPIVSSISQILRSNQELVKLYRNSTCTGKFPPKGAEFLVNFTAVQLKAV
jgi:hypothetical protein